MNFPSGWPEFIAEDGNGERHIADIKTPHGLYIEFQHSHLRPHERAARENSTVLDWYGLWMGRA